MRKLKLILVMVALTLCLAACEREPVEEPSAQPTATNEVKKTESFVTPNPTQEQEPVKKIQSIHEIIQGDAWELGNSQGNLLANGYICENEGKLYYQDFNHDKHLCVMNLDGTEKKVLSEDVPRAIQVVDNDIYYIDDDKNSDAYNRIKKVNKDGSEPQVLGEDRVGSMLVTKEGIFFTGGDYIARMELDGSKTEMIHDKKGSGDFGWFSIYGDCIITGGVLNGKRIVAVKLDGSGEYTLYQEYMYPEVEGDMLYCSGEKGNMTAISIVTGEQKTWSDTYVLRNVFHEGVLYFTNGGQICGIHTDSDRIEVIYPEEKGDSIELYGVAANRIFFTEKLKGEEEVVFKYFDIETKEIVTVP